MFGLSRPKLPPGMEGSGVVEALGPEVRDLKVGDEVFGDTSEHQFGTMAEKMCVSEKALHPKPSELSHVEACTLPHAALLALQGFNLGGLEPGMSVLINGAGGGVGSLGLQIARAMGASKVFGVDSAEKLESLKAQGFDGVWDYRTQDFTLEAEPVDLVLDCKTNRMPWRYLRVLKPGGAYITVGGFLPQLFATFALGGILGKVTGKRLKVLGLKTNQGLLEVVSMVRTGALKACVDGPYPLEQAGHQLGRFGRGEHVGKIVLSMSATKW